MGMMSAFPSTCARRGRSVVSSPTSPASHGATPGQAALAWLIHHPQVVVIPGASTVAQVEANAAAADLELTETEHTALTETSLRFPSMGGLRIARIARRLRRTRADTR
jgi:aryl-alcohol dehydrogenase-like predicted oxidoreductase